MEADRTHTEETSNKHYTTNTYMEPTREEKKRNTENKREKMSYTGRKIEKMATNT